MTIIDPNLCFVLEPFPGTPKKTPHTSLKVGELNRIYNEIVEPAVTGRNLRIVRSSHITRSGYITREHKENTLQAGLIIANVTEADPIVMFCLALRYAQPAPNPDYSVIGLLDREKPNIFDLPRVLTGPITYGLTPTTDQLGDAAQEYDALNAMQSARNELIHAVEQHIIAREQMAAYRPPAVTGGSAASGAAPETVSPPSQSNTTPSETEAFEKFLKSKIQQMLNAEREDYGVRRLHDRLFDHR